MHNIDWFNFCPFSRMAISSSMVDSSGVNVDRRGSCCAELTVVVLLDKDGCVPAIDETGMLLTVVMTALDVGGNWKASGWLDMLLTD